MTPPHRRWEANFIRSMEQRRKAAGMTQTDLARALRDRYGLPFHQQTIQRIESGERPVRLDESHCIADVLGTSVTVMTADLEAPPEEIAQLIRMLYDELAERGGNIYDRIQGDAAEVNDLHETLLAAWESYERRQQAAGKEADKELAATVRRATSRYERFERGISLLGELTDL